MAATIKQGHIFTQEQYASIYGVHANTVNRWQKRNLPVHDPASLIHTLFAEDYWRALKTLSKGKLRILEDYKNALKALKTG